MKKQPWHHSSKTRTAVFSFAAAAVIITAGFIALYFGSHFNGNNFETPKALTGSQLTTVGAPKRLLIPSILVDSKVQQVGLAASGRMGTPTNFTDVAWYSPGPKPGQPGSAVIDGHLDNATNASAVFMNLSKLKINDEIDVVDQTGQKIKFRVTDIKLYADQNAPLDQIFEANIPEARLNLITCDGVWNQATKNYSDRLVVYSVRVLD